MARFNLADVRREYMLAGLSDVALRNWNGIEVGALRATSELRAGLLV